MGDVTFNNLKRKAVAVCVLAFSGVALTGPVTALAANGSWSSTVQRDLNGLSQVGSVNRSASKTFTLAVYTGGGALVGHKTVTIVKGAQDYHDCWGGLNTDKYGHVVTKSTNHDPWFNA